MTLLRFPFAMPSVLDTVSGLIVLGNTRGHRARMAATAGLLVCAILNASAVPLAQAPAAETVQQHLQRAHTFLNERKPQLAIPEFKAVLAADPNNADAVGNLGVLLYFAHDYREAEPLLRQTVAATPLPKLQALLGMCERRNGNTETARRDLAAALPSLDDAAIRREAGLELVELQTSAGDLPAAAGTISALKAKAPEDPVILYAAYRVYTDLAGESMLDLSLSAPRSAQMHQAMAHELLRARDLKGAIANYRDALAADPNLPGIHFELAEALRSSPEAALRAEAEGQYALALKANPGDAKSLTRLADAAAERGDHTKAIPMYQQALTLAPGEVDAGVGLAHELVETGDLPGALRLLQAMETADPTDVLVHFRLSALYRRMQRPEDAKREVAQYEKYKAVKETMRSVYKQMRQDAPGGNASQQ